MRATTTASATDSSKNRSAAGNTDESGASTTARMASAAHSAVDIAAANLEQAEKALKEARETAGEKVHGGAQQAKAYSEDAVAGVKTYIDLYPLRSVGIAVAAGFLLSALLRK